MNQSQLLSRLLVSRAITEKYDLRPRSQEGPASHRILLNDLEMTLELLGCAKNSQHPPTPRGAAVQLPRPSPRVHAIARCPIGLNRARPVWLFLASLPLPVHAPSRH